MTDPSHSPSAPDAAPDGARERLLQAALAVFGETGFEAASTRRLAEAAGVNLAAIPYYFQSKHGLYLAVAEHIAARMWQHMGPAVQAAEATLAGAPDDDALMAALRGVLMPMAEVLIGSRESERWAPFVMREQAHPTEAFDILHRECIAKVLHASAHLLGRILRQEPFGEPNVLTLQTLYGQILVFRASRAAVMRNLRWDEIDDARLEKIQSLVWDNVCAIVQAQRHAGRHA